MRYTFTGPSSLDLHGQTVAATTVALLDSPTEITTGGALGWDTAICLAALDAWPDAHHRVVLPGADYNRPGLEVALRLVKSRGIDRFTVVTLPADADVGRAYRARNERLIDHGDVLVAGLRSPEFYRSGEWMTVNIARRRGVTVRYIVLGRSHA